MRSKSPLQNPFLLGYDNKEPQLLRILLHSGFGAENRSKEPSGFLTLNFHDPRSAAC